MASGNKQKFCAHGGSFDYPLLEKPVQKVKYPL